MTKRYATVAAATFCSPTAPGEALAQRSVESIETDRPGEGRERAKERCVGEGATELLEGDLRGRAGDQAAGKEAVGEVAQAELCGAAGGVDQHVGIGPEAGEEIDLVDQRDVLDDQGTRLHHGLARPDRTVVDPAVRDDGRAHAL